MEYMNKVLIVSQVMPQWYVDLIKSALPNDAEIDCITGSDVNGVERIKAPEYVTNSFKTKSILSSFSPQVSFPSENVPAPPSPN